MHHDFASPLNYDDELRRFDADFLVNCSGLAAGKLVADATMEPLSGVLAVLDHSSAARSDRYDVAVVVGAAADDGEHDVDSFVFVVPRNERQLLVGGCAMRCDAPSAEEASSMAEKMLDRAVALLPDLGKYKLDSARACLVGVRPHRDDGVVVRRDAVHGRVIHNYGHSGAGYTMSYGCADEVVRLAAGIVCPSGRNVGMGTVPVAA